MPVIAPPLPANKTVVYRLTDPCGNPALIKQEDLTSQEPPYFQVMGFAGGGFGLNTPQGQAASVYANIDKAIKNYKTFAESPINRWQAVPVLVVLPRAGRNINAYYNRRSLSFFFAKDKVLNTEIFTADSPDITVHELGHAILDSKRPDLWNVANLESNALHEAWGDIFSIVSQLQHPEVAQAILSLTNGNLRMDNVLSSLAEQLGKTVYNDMKPIGSNGLWLRSALNDFKYIVPGMLPMEARMDQLAADPHSFSRILTGAAYDLIVAIYETEKGTGKDDLTALLDAAKGLGWYIDRTMTRMPNRTQAFYAFTSTLLRVDRDMSQSYYQEKFTEVLQNRQLIQPDVKMLKLDEPIKLLSVRLCDVFPTDEIIALSTNPLYRVEIQMPDEGIIAIGAAKRFVDYIHKHDQVSSRPDAPFEVLNGKLVRNHFDSVEDYRQNWLNPTQPEFYRPPKPWLHFQPCGCKEELEKHGEAESSRRVVRETRFRYRIYK